MATEIVAQAETQNPRSSIQVERNSRGFNWTAKLYAASPTTSKALASRTLPEKLTAPYGGEPDQLVDKRNPRS